VTIRDVAKQAGVSVGTVSNVLNRPNQVSIETRLKVRNAIDTLGFMPIAAINGKITESNVIGVIVTPVGPRNQVFEKFLDSNVRVGYISQTDEYPQQCSVLIDQVRGGFIGIEYLHSLGHRKILWISGPKHHHQSNQRFVGITQAVGEFDIELTTMGSPSLDFLAGEQIAPQIIAIGPLPDAIFAANDTLAMGVINYFNLKGIDVPGTVSVLGYDNTSYAESGLIPLTSVSQTPYFLGQTLGKQMVIDLSAEDGHAHQHVVFQPQIVERASTQHRG
jgi:LacI family transcriptional regulator